MERLNSLRATVNVSMMVQADDGEAAAVQQLAQLGHTQCITPQAQGVQVKPAAAQKWQKRQQQHELQSPAADLLLVVSKGAIMEPCVASTKLLQAVAR